MDIINKIRKVFIKEPTKFSPVNIEKVFTPLHTIFKNRLGERAMKENWNNPIKTQMRDYYHEAIIFYLINKDLATKKEIEDLLKK